MGTIFLYTRFIDGSFSISFLIENKRNCTNKEQIKPLIYFFSEWEQYQGHIYRLFSENLPWADAKVCNYMVYTSLLVF